MEAALGERTGVSDEEWALIGPLLPPEHGCACRPAGDNRRYFEGMMWMARSGAQWQLLPDELDLPRRRPGARGTAYFGVIGAGS